MGAVQTYRVRAVLDHPVSDPGLLVFANRVEQKTSNNTNFMSPGTVLIDLSAATKVYAAAIQTMATSKSASEARNAARLQVLDALGHVKDYVNSVAEKATPEQAKAIIESSGLRTKKHTIRSKPQLEVKYGGISGAVQLIALAAAKTAIYLFAFSTDQKTWTACPQVLQSKTTITGLMVGTTYYFRFQAQGRKGAGDWSMVVSFVVH